MHERTEVSTACVFSNRSCPTCSCPDSRLDNTIHDPFKYRRAAVVFKIAKVDAERDLLLDDDENVLLGKGDDV